MLKTTSIFLLAWIGLSLVGYFLYIETVESDLHARSLKAVSSAGHEWLSFSQQGRDLSLHGKAPDEDALNDAVHIVRNVYGVRVVETDQISSEFSDDALLEMKSNESDIDGVGDSQETYSDGISRSSDGQIETSVIDKNHNSFYPCRIDTGSLASHTMIYFETASSSVDSEGMELLGRLAVLLNDCPFYRVAITGHTDLRGDQVTNQQLSERRAANVKLRLIDLGVHHQRIDISGVAASSPNADNMTIDGLAGNRRVEIAVIQ